MSSRPRLAYIPLPTLIPQAPHTLADLATFRGHLKIKLQSAAYLRGRPRRRHLNPNVRS